jgi:c-di-GMP-binding flagellar brake protein YcgR
MGLDLFRKLTSSKEEDQKRQKNAAILDLALLQRSKVHIQFDERTSNLKGVTGTIIALNASGIVLELSGLSNIKERFADQTINCFFRIVEREDRHREIFYNFTTTILRVRQLPDKLPQIAVAFPTSLQGAQRRKSLRMKPHLEQFSHIALWKYDASGGFDIAKPTIGHAHFKANHAVLDNLSAGGLRLSLHRELLKEQQLDPQKGHRFIFFSTFAEDILRLRKEYWLVCKVNNVQRDPVSGEVVMGLEFIANGVRQEESSKVEWSKITDNVIDDLAQRIYEWHIALYRSKGVAG